MLHTDIGPDKSNAKKAGVLSSILKLSPGKTSSIDIENDSAGVVSSNAAWDLPRRHTLPPGSPNESPTSLQVSNSTVPAKPGFSE